MSEFWLKRNSVVQEVRGELKSSLQQATVNSADDGAAANVSNALQLTSLMHI